MATRCPYCDMEVSESAIEAEDGCCPECGSVISSPSLLMEGDEEIDMDDDFDVYGDDDYEDDDSYMDDDLAEDFFEDEEAFDEDFDEDFK